MAIQPIDLQTLFTQMEKVGKREAFQREGMQIQASLQSLESQRRTEEQVQSVNETQNIGEGVEAVNNRERRRGSGEKDQEKEKEKETAWEEAQGVKISRIIRDPSLGRNVDVSG